MIELHVNGAVHQLDVDPERTVLSVLRDDLDLTGTKYGCGEGACRTCTVLVDGEALPSCQMQVGQAEGHEITTIEGLAKGDELHPLQRAFIELDVMQCGYCTPGMILAASALLQRNQDPTEDDVVQALEGHICRCGTYQRIIEATRQVAATMRGGQ